MEPYNVMIENFRIGVSNMVRQIFMRDKVMYPIAIMLVIKPENKEPSLVVMAGLEKYMGTNEDRDKLVDIIRKAGKNLQPIAIAMASEGYLAVADTLDEARSMKNPKDYPGGIEAVVINFETHDKTAFESYEIKRMGDYAELIDNHSTEFVPHNESELVSRFSNFLKENYNLLEQLGQINMN